MGYNPICVVQEDMVVDKIYEHSWHSVIMAGMSLLTDEIRAQTIVWVEQKPVQYVFPDCYHANSTSTHVEKHKRNHEVDERG